MPAARALSPPTRRSLLLSGAVLVPLGLAGCDPDGPEGEEGAEESPPPRTTVTVEELLTSPSVVPDRRAFRGAWPVRATAERPISMLFAHDLDGWRSIDACLSTSQGSIEIQLEETTTSTAADGTGETARVFASVPDGPRYRTTMHTSQNLTTWSSVPLEHSWTELGRVDPAVYEGPEQSQGVQLHQLVEVDGTLIGIGAVLGEDGCFRAATVILGEEPWAVRTLEQSLTGFHLPDAHRRGGEVVVGYWWDDVLEYGVLTAKGTVDTEDLLWMSGEESRSVLDLGDGALLTVGVDDAIVIAGDGARPYGYRIIGPKQQLLPADG